MKKRLLSLFLVLAMLCAISIGASAVTVEGNTTKYADGAVPIWTRATLDMTRTYASASTESGSTDTSILWTTVLFYYYDTNNDYVSIKDEAHAVAGVYPDDLRDGMAAVRAKSTHSVAAGLSGMWSCTLNDSF